MYAGIDPVTKKRHNLIEHIPPGPKAEALAEAARVRLVNHTYEGYVDKHVLPFLGDHKVGMSTPTSSTRSTPSSCGAANTATASPVVLITGPYSASPKWRRSWSLASVPRLRQLAGCSAWSQLRSRRASRMTSRGPRGGPLVAVGPAGVRAFRGGGHVAAAGVGGQQ